MVAFMHTGTRLTAGYRYTTLGDATSSETSVVQLFSQLCRNLRHLCYFHCLFSSAHSCTATRNLTSSAIAV